MAEDECCEHELKDVCQEVMMEEERPVVEEEGQEVEEVTSQ